MNIKNYTTSVPSDRSISNIEKLLIDFGASHIMKEAEFGRVKSITFRILVEGTPVSFKLPANVPACFNWLSRQRKTKSRNKESLKVLEAQAERLAWKHQFEWLHIQLTGITLDQIETVQALLPYAVDAKGETFYDRLKNQNFKLLTTGQ